jgi:predicted flavoprotein YhiN
MRLPFLKKKKILKPEEIAQRLDAVPTRETVEQIVAEINKKKERRELWNSLTPRMREKVLRHIVERSLTHAKKK